MEFIGVGRVQVAGGFIGKNNFGLIDQGPGNGYPLLFATRKALGLIFHSVGQAQSFSNLAALSSISFLALPAIQPGNTHIFQCGKFGQEMVKLENKPNMLVPESRQGRYHDAANGLLFDANAALSGISRVPKICSKVLLPPRKSLQYSQFHPA